MMSKGHYIKRRKKTIIPEAHLFIDTEAYIRIEKDTEYHSFRCAVVGYYRRSRNNVEYKMYQSRNALWADVFDYFDALIEEGIDVVYVWCHNADYDVQILGVQYYFGSPYIHTVFFVDEGLRYIHIARYTSRFHEGTLRVVWLSSTNFFIASLSSLGDMVNLSKIESADKTPIWASEDDNLVLQYCKRDVEILARVMIHFFSYWDTHQYGPFPLTAAGAAMNAYKTRFLKEPIYAHRDISVLQLEYDAYKGGRTECFYLGEQRQVYHLDVNSMYPYVMKTFPYPIQLRGYKENTSLRYLRRLMQEYLVIADCTIAIEQPAIGFRDSNTHKLICPVGTFRVALTSPEIELVLQIGKIHKVHRVAYYRGAYIFQDFVEHFFEQRKAYKQQKNKIMEQFAKIILNSLYGKFAQRHESFEYLGQTTDVGIGDTMCITPDGKREKYRQVGYTLYHTDGRVEVGYDAFPSISAHVSAYARCYLYLLMSIAGRENVYYCDTDSLFVSKEGYNRLLEHGFVNNEALGGLKLEGIYPRVIFRGAKDYIIYKDEGMVVKRKGIRADAQQVGPNTFKQQHFLSLKTNQQRYKHDGVVVEHVAKHLNGEYDKGKIDSDGYVIPHRLSGESEEWKTYDFNTTIQPPSPLPSSNQPLNQPSNQRQKRGKQRKQEIEVENVVDNHIDNPEDYEIVEIEV